ncbi:flagellar assembly protein FliW [Angelakisella massiliensis]|uniref:flagellar assembly protein FliW n=1 Tax=Angelakisella massiliensis TaxID=1871018 RepID=UPI0008F84DFC|nr:flagellar assembly protein FliW [Angelakisella massiliensis]
MELKTKYFGPIEYTPQDILSFPNGLFGFETENEFLPLPFDGSGGDLICFQSVRTPELSFVAMNPFSLDPSYTPVLSPEELKFMGVEKSEELCYYVLCAVREPVSESTLNLRCPVVVHPQRKIAVQVILEDTPYHMRHRLGDFSAGGDAQSC